MGIKVMDIFPDACLPVFTDTMMFDSHDMYLSKIQCDTCFVFDWSTGIREIICGIYLGADNVCTLVHNTNAEPGLQFRKKTGEIIGEAPLRKDYTGIREDIEYSFLEIGEPMEFPDHSYAGTMQRISLKCD